MTPAILLPAQAPNVYSAARLYAALEFSVLPCVGKKPALKWWKHLQTRIADATTIDLWYKTGLLTNVGIICGAVSGNLVVIDLDKHEAVLTFKLRFPDLFNTYAVTSGSGSGMHLYFYTRVLPPTTRVVGMDYGNVELRADGCYVVAPPSIHPDSGKPYSVAFADEIAVIDDLHDVVNWIKRQIQQKHGGHMPPSNAGRVVNATAYGRAALLGETGKVQQASAGERNHRLFEAALRMGSLISDGKIGAAEVERALFAAAGSLSATDGEAATLRTIQSGLQRGMEHSRDQHRRA